MERDADRNDLRYAAPLPTDLTQPGPNESLPIYTGPIAVSAQAVNLEGQAMVELRWLPSPTLICRVDFESSADSSGLARVISGDPNDEVQFRVTGGGGVARRHRGNSHPDAPWGEFRIYDVWTIDHGGEASELRFEVVNMDNVMGAPVSYDKYSWGADLLQLASSRWSVDLQAVRDGWATSDTLRESGGYAVTHTARAVLQDGSTIRVADVEPLLTTLQYALSFAADRWVTPVRARGIAASGDLAWEIWGLWNTDPWSSPMTWFSRGSVDGIAEIFRAIDDRWPDQYWERLLRTSMHYYLDATHGLVNRQLIMSAALLELIGWHVVVEENNLLSGNRYDRLETSDRIRMLLGLMKYPLGIPLELPALRAFAKPASDIATVLAEVRHAVVHAKRHRSLWEMDEDVWMEVTELSREVYNAAMLFLLGYTGRYVNQITARYAEDDGPVPWSPDFN